MAHFSDSSTKPYSQDAHIAKFNDLYLALVFAFNLDDYLKPDSPKWAGWCEELSGYVNDLPKIITMVKSGQLSLIMGNRGKPTGKDLITLAKQLKRNAIKQLEHRPAARELNAAHVRSMIEAARQDPRGKHGNQDFKNTREFKNDPRREIDREISRRTGTEPKL